MQIRLTPEQEQLVQDELKFDHSRTVEEVIAKALHALREKEQSSGNVSSNGAQQREAVREILAFVEKNRVRPQALTVKELIHEGHRL